LAPPLLHRFTSLFLNTKTASLFSVDQEESVLQWKKKKKNCAKEEKREGERGKVIVLSLSSSLSLSL